MIDDNKNDDSVKKRCITVMIMRIMAFGDGDGLDSKKESQSVTADTVKRSVWMSYMSK